MSNEFFIPFSEHNIPRGIVHGFEKSNTVKCILDSFSRVNFIYFFQIMYNFEYEKLCDWLIKNVIEDYDPYFIARKLLKSSILHSSIAIWDHHT